MKLYLFDVDKTLEISNGPVTLGSIVDLRNEGHIIGLCGNWGLVMKNVHNWHQLFSVANILIDKANFMYHLKQYCPAEDYIMVGNNDNPLYSGSPNDKAFADAAGWRFIAEIDFARGVR